MLINVLGLSMPGNNGWALIAVGLLLFFYWIKTLVEVVRRDFADPSKKILWGVIVVFFGIIGAAVYNFFGKQKSA